MGADQRFFYKFENETAIDDFVILGEADGKATLRATLELPLGDYVFLAPCFADKKRYASIMSLEISGEEMPLNKKHAVYVEYEYARYGIPFSHSGGEAIITATVGYTEGLKITKDSLAFSVIRDEARPTSIITKKRIHKYEKLNYLRKTDRATTDGWCEGIGHKPSSGRFGFSKGDGLLDSGMPSLGFIDKMFLSGQPKYEKPYRWSYTVFPEGMPLHGSFEPRDVDIDEDELEVNHLSVKWGARYNGERFSCTYSLASPAVIIESDSGKMHLGGLRFAGNYQSVLIPKKDGVEEVSLDEADISSMAENWILLYNSTEFPDVPIMLTFDKNPEKMIVTRDKGERLRSVDFLGVSRMTSSTPFGIERFDVCGMPIDRAIKICRFLSRVYLAYPVAHKDYFKLDFENKRVNIRQTFEYRYFEDAWGTEPLELAVYPPALSLSGLYEYSDISELNFPTKYGVLKARVGTHSDYSLPFMPTERKFPLRGKDSSLPKLLSEEIELYKELSSAFPLERVSYPYAGALLEPFAFASTLGFFMNDTDREFIRKHLDERIKEALNPERISDYTVISWGELMAKNPSHREIIDYYNSDERSHLALHNWYERVEPFTGAAFNICYLNVSMLANGVVKVGTKEEILGLKKPLIENDWGVGLTFYYLYLSALSIGSFDEIRKRWELIKSVYAFFELMHDYACMGTGYSDNGITWVEGANYGLFVSFIKMAEAVGDTKARDFGIYNAAKQLCLRLAVINASAEYFPKYFDTAPWYCTKHFHEEFCPYMAFQNASYTVSGGYRPGGIYNLTTEGLYPEAYTALRALGGENYKKTMHLEGLAVRSGDNMRVGEWTKMQEYSASLIDKALDEECSIADFEESLALGLKKNLVMRDFRGIHIFSRALPKNYLICQLYAWLEMRSHETWLLHWEEMLISDATYDGGRANVTFTHSGNGKMKLIAGVRREPLAVRLSGEPIAYTLSDGKLYVEPDSDGVLEIIFN